MLGGGFHCHTRHMRYLPLLLLLAGISVSAETIHQGKVVKIADGDTLTLLVDSEQLKIRLSDIDTPERKQPFGTKAKQALSEAGLWQAGPCSGSDSGPLRTDCGAGLCEWCGRESGAGSPGICRGVS